MKMLDAGAYDVICPMISTREDAERFVDACRYAPRGHRFTGHRAGCFMAARIISTTPIRRCSPSL
jgi:2-keto-3-deoxy-L-rhamnonate aldolase RhmA